MHIFRRFWAFELLVALGAIAVGLALVFEPFSNDVLNLPGCNVLWQGAWTLPLQPWWCTFQYDLKGLLALALCPSSLGLMDDLRVDAWDITQVVGANVALYLFLGAFVWLGTFRNRFFLLMPLFVVSAWWALLIFAFYLGPLLLGS